MLPSAAPSKLPANIDLTRYRRKIADACRLSLAEVDLLRLHDAEQLRYEKSLKESEGQINLRRERASSTVCTFGNLGKLKSRGHSFPRIGEDEEIQVNFLGGAESATEPSAAGFDVEHDFAKPVPAPVRKLIKDRVSAPSSERRLSVPKRHYSPEPVKKPRTGGGRKWIEICSLTSFCGLLETADSSEFSLPDDFNSQYKSEVPQSIRPEEETMPHSAEVERPVRKSLRLQRVVVSEATTSESLDKLVAESDCARPSDDNDVQMARETDGLLEPLDISMDTSFDISTMPKIKRGRGRPRKYPLDISMTSNSTLNETIGTNGALSDGESKGEPSRSRRKLVRNAGYRASGLTKSGSFQLRSKRKPAADVSTEDSNDNLQIVEHLEDNLVDSNENGVDTVKGGGKVFNENDPEKFGDTATVDSDMEVQQEKGEIRLLPEEKLKCSETEIS